MFVEDFGRNFGGIVFVGELGSHFVQLGLHLGEFLAQALAFRRHIHQALEGHIEFTERG